VQYVCVAQPVLFAVDDTPEGLSLVGEELWKRYGADYRVVCESSVPAGLAALERAQAAGSSRRHLHGRRGRPQGSSGNTTAVRPTNDLALSVVVLAAGTRRRLTTN
jgi:hypothetical protein